MVLGLSNGPAPTFLPCGLLSLELCGELEMRSVEHGICPLSLVRNERAVPIIIAGCIAHARNGHISTSGLKSDVTIVFLDPDFLTDAKIFGDLRTFKADIKLPNICMGFQDLVA